MHPFGGTPKCPRCSTAVYAAEQVRAAPAHRKDIAHAAAVARLDHGPRTQGTFHLPVSVFRPVLTPVLAVPQGTRYFFTPFACARLNECFGTVLPQVHILQQTPRLLLPRRARRTGALQYSPRLARPSASHLTLSYLSVPLARILLLPSHTGAPLTRPSASVPHPLTCTPQIAFMPTASSVTSSSLAPATSATATSTKNLLLVPAPTPIRTAPPRPPQAPPPLMAVTSHSPSRSAGT